MRTIVCAPEGYLRTRSYVPGKTGGYTIARLGRWLLRWFSRRWCCGGRGGFPLVRKKFGSRAPAWPEPNNLEHTYHNLRQHNRKHAGRRKEAAAPKDCCHEVAQTSKDRVENRRRCFRSYSQAQACCQRRQGPPRFVGLEGGGHA